MFEIDIFYEGKQRSFGEAGALLVRQMLSELKELREYKQGGWNDPMEYFSNKLKSRAGRHGKSPKTISNWTHDWFSTYGAPPTVEDLCYLGHLTGSNHFLSFVHALIGDSREIASDTSDVFKEVGESMLEMGEKFLQRSREIENQKSLTKVKRSMNHGS